LAYEPTQVAPEDDYNRFILIKKQAATVKLISAFHLVRSRIYEKLKLIQ
jgi:hypothetical protein